MKRVQLLCVLVVLCQAVYGQEPGDFPDEWEAVDMPNPVKSPQHCHLKKRGYVCDPDRILTEREMELLDWLLSGFYVNDTRCPCSRYWCERDRMGAHLSIAVVRKLKLADTFQEPRKAKLQAASNFALQLRKAVWNFGDCENNIVILYSKDDGVLFIAYGTTIALKMSNQEVEYIQQLYGHEFREGGDILTGFIDIILAMRQSLNGATHFDPNQPYFEQLLGSASYTQSSGVLATVGLAALMSHLLYQ